MSRLSTPATAAASLTYACSHAQSPVARQARPRSRHWLATYPARAGPRPARSLSHFESPTDIVVGVSPSGRAAHLRGGDVGVVTGSRCRGAGKRWKCFPRTPSAGVVVARTVSAGPSGVSTQLAQTCAGGAAESAVVGLERRAEVLAGLPSVQPARDLPGVRRLVSAQDVEAERGHLAVVLVFSIANGPVGPGTLCGWQALSRSRSGRPENARARFVAHRQSEGVSPPRRAAPSTGMTEVRSHRAARLRSRRSSWSLDRNGQLRRRIPDFGDTRRRIRNTAVGTTDVGHRDSDGRGVDEWGSRSSARHG